jgi:hypothetical protein|nr:MAG TPA: putative transcriptional regulator [Caudoviricetes sp.]
MKERVIKLLDYLGLTAQQFELRVGLSNGAASKMGDGTRRSTLDKISNAFPNVNTNWLLTGEGEMLKNGKELIVGASDMLEKDIRMIPLLPISAQGGSLNDFVISVKESDCERIISPIKGVDYAMSVSGDSMAPEYPPGSQILIKRINEKAFIDWGRVYVLDTCNGTVIKKLYPSEKPDTVVCKSINSEYPPFEVCFSDIYGIYRVLMCMSLK